MIFFLGPSIFQLLVLQLNLLALSVNICDKLPKSIFLPFAIYDEIITPFLSIPLLTFHLNPWELLDDTFCNGIEIKMVSMVSIVVPDDFILFFINLKSYVIIVFGKIFTYLFYTFFAHLLLYVRCNFC